MLGGSFGDTAAGRFRWCSGVDCVFYLGFATLVPQIYSKNTRATSANFTQNFTQNFTHGETLLTNFTQNITHGETLLTTLLTNTLNRKTPDHGSKPWSNNLGTFPRCLRTPLGFPPARYTTVLLFSGIVSSLEHALQLFFNDWRQIP